MRVIFYLLIVCTLSLNSLTIYSQYQGRRGDRGSFRGQGKPQGVVTGRIIDSEHKKPLGYANVILYRHRDSSMVTGAITDEDGNFKINNVPFGRFFLTAKFLGYKSRNVKSIEISPRKKSHKIKTIELTISSVQTQEVEVFAEKPHIEYKLDKKIVNVSRDITSAGGSAVDALENVPSIEVSIEGEVSLRGSTNFTLYIDGRPSVLEGSDGLEQIPAAAIENIEIITNPSAKHDPDGVSGIINVILKKNKDLGSNGLSNISVGTRDKYSADVLLNYNNSKFNLLGGYTYRKRNSISERVSEQRFYYDETTSYTDTDGEGVRLHGGYSFKAAAGYNLTDKTSLMLNSKIGVWNFERSNNSIIQRWIDPGKDISNFLNDNVILRERDYYSINMDLLHRFNENGDKLYASVYYSGRAGGGEDVQNEFMADNSWIKSNIGRYSIKTNEDEDSEDIRFKVDFEGKISEDYKIEAGIQSRLNRENELFTLENYDTLSNKWIINEEFNNAMDFTRDIYSAYVTTTGDFFGLKYKAGLRSEYTYRKIIDEKIDKTYSIDRIDFFPSFHISHDLGKNNLIAASYSSRIRRPRGYHLEPFPSFIDSENIRLGNPGLGPEYIDSYELNFQNYVKSSFVSLEAYYRVTKDKISRIRTFDSTTKIVTHQSTNIDKDYMLGFELMLNYEPVKWFKFNLSGNFYNYRIEGTIDGDIIDNSSDVWSSRLNITWIAAQFTRLQLTGYYYGPRINTQGEGSGSYGMNLAVRQDFLNRNISLTLQMRNILNTNIEEGTISTENYYSHNKYTPEWPLLTLTFSYRFNDYKQKRDSWDDDVDME